MKKHISLAFLILIAFNYACNSDGKTNESVYEKINFKLGKKLYEIPFSFSVEEREPTIRNWKKSVMEYEFSIGGIEDTTLYAPVSVKTDADNNIYILDMKACSVKKFDKDGNFLRSYGGKGRGPGEFISPSRFDVLLNGKIIVLDSNLGKYEVFGEDTNYTVKLQTDLISDISFISESEFCDLQFWNVSAHPPIRRYNLTNDEIDEYKNLFRLDDLEDIPLGPLPILQGDLIKYYNSLVYVPEYMNYFFMFSPDGKSFKAYKTIDDIKLPSVEINNSTIFNLKVSKEYQSALASNVVEDKLIIVSAKESREVNAGVLDYYSLMEGKYLYSTQLERLGKLIAIYIFKNRILALTPEGEIKVFSYKIYD